GCCSAGYAVSCCVGCSGFSWFWCVVCCLSGGDCFSCCCWFLVVVGSSAVCVGVGAFACCWVYSGDYLAAGCCVGMACGASGVSSWCGGWAVGAVAVGWMVWRDSFGRGWGVDLVCVAMDCWPCYGGA